MAARSGKPSGATTVRGTRVLVGAVQTVLAAGTALGIERRELLAAAGLAEEQLADRDAYVPFARQIALGEAIIERRPGTSIGLAALRHASPAMLGVLGYVVSASATLRDALDAFVRFQGLMTDGVRFDIAGSDPVRVVLEADPRLARLAHPLEALAGLWVTLGRQLTRTEWAPRAVAFAHAPLAGAREYERFFGVAPRFGAKANSISLSRETMALPVVAAKAALRPSLLFLCETQLAALDGRQGLTSRARAALLEQIPRGVASRSEVARALGLSERSLNRKLQAEGATYRDVLDDVRRELALAWLADADQAVYEVAFLLGYSEPSTFHRSFRRWTGASPLAWRKRAAG